MEYYIFSLFTSIIIFIIIQFIEYNKYKNNEDQYTEPYNIFTIANILLFLILYIVFTIGFFYLKPTFLSSIMDFLKISNDNSNIKNNDNIDKDIDPKVLSKITDNFDTGFAPFNSDEESSISSLSSKED